MARYPLTYAGPYRIVVRDGLGGMAARVLRRGIPHRYGAKLQAEQWARARGEWVSVIDSSGRLVAEYDARRQAG